MNQSKRANNVIRIPTSLKGNFFRMWIEFLTPLHDLTNREKDVLAALLKIRFELSKSISDDALLDKIVMSGEMKAKVKQEAGVSNAFYQVILGKLKKNNLIVNGRIEPKLIPKIPEESASSCQLLLYFDLNAKDNQ